VGGASIAYHLTELGWQDVLLVDRSELTSGSTFHSAGLVGQLRADPALTRMNQYSVELYRRLPYPTTVRVAVPDSASAHASMRSCSPCDPCHGGSRRSVAAEDRPV